MKIKKNQSNTKCRFKVGSIMLIEPKRFGSGYKPEPAKMRIRRLSGAWKRWWLSNYKSFIFL